MYKNKKLKNLLKSSQKNYNKSVKNNQNVVSEIFGEYLSRSTIHGLWYLGSKDKSLLERVFWIIGIILSITAGIFAINKMWTRWDNHPVVITFAQHYTHISEIPFPAVTICPVHSVRPSVFNYTKYHTMPNKSEVDIDKIKMLRDLQFICDKYHKIESVQYETTNDSIMHNIKKVAPTANNTIQWIHWKTKRVKRTTTLFADQITREGLCYSFNALSHDDMYTEQMKNGLKFIEHNRTIRDWNPESGYNAVSKDNYPARLSIHGLGFGLNMILHSEVNDKDKYCEDNTNAFKIALHNPADKPKFFDNYFFAPTNQKLFVSVIPKITKTSKTLKRIDFRIRKCYFIGEKSLRFYKVYTAYNCKMECLANLTIHLCDCVPFYLPRDNNSKVCGNSKIECINDSYGLLYKFNLMDKYHFNANNTKNGVEIYLKCLCYPSCYYVDYNVQVSQTHFEHSKMFKVTKWDKTPVNIFYADETILALERRELYDDVDFVANVGGLLGLCMGFSILSFLEIIYYLTVHLICKIYNRRKKTYINPVPTKKIVFVH